MSWPTELGGRGLGAPGRRRSWRRSSVTTGSRSPSTSSPAKTIGAALERFASPELKKRLLPPLARGELVFCQGFSEPEPGATSARCGHAQSSRAIASSSTATRSGRRARTWRTGSTSPCAPTRSGRSTRDLGARRGHGNSRDHRAAVPDARRRRRSARCSSTPWRSRVEPRRRAQRRLGRCSCTRSTSSGSRPRSSAASPGFSTTSSSTSRRPAASTLRGSSWLGFAASSRRPDSSPSAPPGSSTAASRPPRRRRWRSWRARA